jgi:uncharacterized protein (DUF58 family)
MTKTAKKIIIKTRKKVFSEISGNNISSFKGDGLDFFELKEYSHGDDIKKINWKVTARAKKPFINIYNEERELNVVIVFAISGSIYFGTKKLKQELMAETMGLLGFSAIKNQDRLSIVGFSNKEEFFVKPTKKEFAVISGVQKALETDPIGKELDFKKLSDLLSKKVKRKSVIFIISDFADPNIELKTLSKKHEIICVATRDKIEENLSSLGEISIKNPITMQQEQLNIDEKLARKYNKTIQQNDNKLKQYLLKNKIKLVKIYTNEDPFIKLMKELRFQG